MDINKELFKNVTVLYVEDNDMAREEVEFFLKRYVKKLIIAKDGLEGLKMFKEHNPDMVISDIQMPNMSGLAMSRKILELNPSIPIALTTAYSDSEYLIDAIELGIDKYILKPLNLQEILAVIQKSLQLDYESKYYEEYIQFIVDSNNTFMFIVNSNKIEYVNENLSVILNENNIEILEKDFIEYKDLFELVNLDTEKSYIEQIMENPNEQYLVSFKNKECLKLLNREFIVKFKYFESMGRSVFIFTEVNDQKLNEIKNISVGLKNNYLKDKNDRMLFDNLDKIIELSSKS